jgi:hypothetical protein
MIDWLIGFNYIYWSLYVYYNFWCKTQHVDVWICIKGGGFSLIWIMNIQQLDMNNYLFIETNI